MNISISTTGPDINPGPKADECQKQHGEDRQADEQCDDSDKRRADAPKSSPLQRQNLDLSQDKDRDIGNGQLMRDR